MIVNRAAQNVLVAEFNAAGPILAAKPPEANIQATGIVRINPWTYNLINTGTLFPLDPSMLEKLAELLNKVLRSDFFMTPPLLIDIALN